MIHLPFRKGLPKGPGILRTFTDSEDPDWFAKLPDHIKYSLDKSQAEDGPFGRRASGLGWEEVIYTPNADGTAITSASETILLPDFSIPASYLTVGKVLKYTIMGRQSTAVTTPGTITFRLRWGGVAGVAVITSGAFAPNTAAVATNLTWMLEYWMQCRSVGAAGTAMGFGRIEWSDYNDTSTATLKANLDMRMAPVATPAVATIDTTIDKLISATYQHSLTTASVQTHFGILEACN